MGRPSTITAGWMAQLGTFEMLQKARCPKSDVAAYAYVPQSEIKPYWDMAQKYTFAEQHVPDESRTEFPSPPVHHQWYFVDR